MYAWSDAAANKWKLLHKNGHLLPRMVHLAPIVAMTNMSRWDSDCRDMLLSQMASNLVFDRFILMAFGSNSFIDDPWLDEVVGADFVRQRTRDRLESLGEDSDRPLLKSALNKVTAGMFG